jgi:hypothetical protein
MSCYITEYSGQRLGKGGQSSDCPILRYRYRSSDFRSETITPSLQNGLRRQSNHRFQMACLESKQSFHRLKLVN